MGEDFEKQQWRKYPDIESEIIEEAYRENNRTNLVELDDYWIDLTHFIQINKLDSEKVIIVQRTLNNEEEQTLREERFFPPLRLGEPFNEWTNGGYWFINEWQKRQPEDISHRERLEQAANGILIEGQLLSKTIAAERFAQRLRDMFYQDEIVIHRCCINMYTYDCFIYPLVNRTLRQNDKTKIDTLGPFCYYLYYSWYNLFELRVSNIEVYRGTNLDAQMIEQYQKNIGKEKCWFGFTSTSKNKGIADVFSGNTLFINKMAFSSAIDISDYSQIPDEEEVLFPAGTKFIIEKVECDTINRIYIKLLAKNDSLQQKLNEISSTTITKFCSGFQELDVIDAETLAVMLK
ncbi:unnamed protein product, partial [Didymodactylos carnosus]